MASPTPRTASAGRSPLDDPTEQFGDWMQTHGRQVAIGVGIVAAMTLGGLWLRNSRAGRNARAETAYLQAQGPLAAGDAAAAQRELRLVAQRYDGTAGGAEAQMLLAQLLFDEGKYQEGLTVLDQASDAPSALAPSVRVLGAAGLEGLGKHADAARRYEEAAKSAASPIERDELRAAAARSFQAGGDRASATRLWSELAAQSNSSVADEARVRLGELSATRS